MRRVATQISDATVLMNTMRGNLSRVSSLDGARNPEESLREVKNAIASGNHLLAILDDLRARYVGACLAHADHAGNDALILFRQRAATRTRTTEIL